MSNEENDFNTEIALKDLPKQPEMGDWAIWNMWTISAIETINDNLKTIARYILRKNE